MEISLMIANMKTEAESMKKELEEKERAEKSLQLQLGVLSTEIKDLTEKYEAVSKALKSLAVVYKESAPVGGIHAIKPAQKRKGHSTSPRRIGKFDPNGVKIGEYPSITQAAKAFGWNNIPMTKYISDTPKDKQIRLRGFYLEFIAA